MPIRPLLVCLLVALTASAVFAEVVRDGPPPFTRLTTGWGVGTFEYPQVRVPEPTLVVWTETAGPDGKLSRFSGIVEPNSRIRVPNIEKFDTKNLSSLNGRLVCAWGRIRQEGQGEGTKLYVEEVYILVLQ